MLLIPRALAGLFVVLLAVTFSDSAEARSSKKKSKPQMLILDGIPERVYWNDGDSFRVTRGTRKGQKARLRGYNTLESYGPVHFWGDFHGWELYRTHKAATKLAGETEWECTSDGSADGYGRILVDCPELRKQLISKGLAHVYAYGDEPDPDLVALQLKAQSERVGMWQKGVPEAIVTSVHSMDEPTDDKSIRVDSYNRMCDTQTGKTFVAKHTATFKTCDVFCWKGSCMLYVPFSARYGDKKAACLRGDAGELNRMGAPKHLDAPLADYGRR